MFNFLRSVFYGIPSTKSYEAKLQDEETKYTVYLETLESDGLRRYNELKEYLANPANLKVGSDQPQKERQLEKDYKAKVEAFEKKGFRLDKEFQEKRRRQPHRESQQKKNLQQKNKLAKSNISAESKKERKKLRRQLDVQFKEEKRRLNKQIAMDRHHLKEEGIQLKQELEVENLKLKKEYDLAKHQLKADLQQQKDELKKLKQELKNLENSKLIKDFFSFKKKYSKLIEEQERWVSKFYEDFSKNTLDARWSDKQIVSEQLINGAPYSPIEDLHIFSPDNLQQSGGLLKIKTKQEKKQGLAWDKTYGFVPKTFSYTSGMLTSSHSFKQLYGKFEAKVRVKHTHGTYHAFWMGTDTQKPHLNIFKFEDKNLAVAAYAKNAEIERKLKYRLKDDFYIYTLLWSNDKLSWFINGKKVFESSNVINEPMYMSFSSGVYDKKAEATVMYIDWVRCFRSN
ncbi:MAG: family 16 glycosylhydrolase [Prevotellaceae bacterium]|jgi:hypothetical protein|nr:family 16 glycosylhydrolase [Prevotellaceae bacterium]